MAEHRPGAVVVHWPIPYDHEPNDFEVVGRYIAQTIQMERFIDLILLDQGWSPRKVKRAKLQPKIDAVEGYIEADARRREVWSDLPDKMRKVARNRNDFAHRMFERGALPVHYAQGLQYERLTDEELHEQEGEAFIASELCRQLAGWFLYAPLNDNYQYLRGDPVYPPQPS